MASSQGTSMIVVPASFLSQEWANQVSMKPAQRYFNPVATGQRLFNSLSEPNQADVNKRSTFLNELGKFNDYNRHTLDKPQAVRLKAKSTKKSKNYEDVTLEDMLAKTATNLTPNQTPNTRHAALQPSPKRISAPPPPPPPATYSSAMRATQTRLELSPGLLAAASMQLKKTSKPTTSQSKESAFMHELSKAVKNPQMKPTPIRSKKTYSQAHPVARLFQAEYATPEAVSRRTRSKKQQGHGFKRPFQYVSFNKHKRARRVHLV